LEIAILVEIARAWENPKGRRSLVARLNLGQTMPLASKGLPPAARPMPWGKGPDIIRHSVNCNNILIGAAYEWGSEGRGIKSHRPDYLQAAISVENILLKPTRQPGKDFLRG
jgi:hypothetical protein